MQILIFSGYNQRAVIAFLRTLTLNKITSYSIVARDYDDTILETIYKDKVFCVRESSNLDINYFIDLLIKIKNTYVCEQVFLAPTTEYLNRFFLTYREVIEERGGVIPLTNAETYIKISDKESFQDICASKALMIPEKMDFPVDFSVPFVVKPKKYFGSDGSIHAPILILTSQDFRDFSERYNKEDFYCQEYVSGRSFYLLFYFSKEGQCYSFAQENVLQQPFGKSIVAAKYSKLYKENISKNYEKLFCDLDFTGLVMVELRKIGRKYFMIEANPRFWGPSQFFVDSQYNFFEFMLYDYGFKILDKEQKGICTDAKYFWSGGMNVYRNAELVKYVTFNRCEYEAYDVYNREDTKIIYEQE